MLASVRYVDLGRVGEMPPDGRSGAEAPSGVTRDRWWRPTSTVKATLDRRCGNRPSLIRSPSPVPRALVGNNLTG